jgi:cell division protein FtsL
MVKLLICLVGGALIAVSLLQLRQQQLQLGHQCNDLHRQIRGRQAKLWNQQLEIAVYTAPNAIAQTVANHDLRLVPESPAVPGRPSWTDAGDDPAVSE